MISEKEIYNLAWREQLSVWYRERTIYEKTESNVARIRTERAWQKLQDIERLIKEKGYNE